MSGYILYCTYDNGLTRISVKSSQCAVIVNCPLLLFSIDGALYEYHLQKQYFIAFTTLLTYCIMYAYRPIKIRNLTFIFIFYILYIIPKWVMYRILEFVVTRLAEEAPAQSIAPLKVGKYQLNIEPLFRSTFGLTVNCVIWYEFYQQHFHILMEVLGFCSIHGLVTLFIYNFYDFGQSQSMNSAL